MPNKRKEDRIVRKGLTICSVADIKIPTKDTSEDKEAKGKMNQMCPPKAWVGVYKDLQ